MTATSVFAFAIGPAGQQTYRTIVLINPAATAAILPNLNLK